MQRQLLTVQQVANLLQVSRATVYREIQTGRLTAVHIGRCIRITTESVDAYVHATDEGLTGSVSHA